jgi:hypothetical protein
VTLMPNFQRFQKEQVTLLVDTTTGEVAATQGMIATICKQESTTIRYYLNKEGCRELLNDFPVMDSRGVEQLSKIYDEDAILKCILNYNSHLVPLFSKLGLRVYLHELAGFKVSSTAIQTKQVTNDSDLLKDIKDIFTGIRDDLRKSEEKANKYFQLSESHLKNMYNMYPSYFRMQDIQTGLSKFSTLEKLLKEVSEQLETTAIQRFYPLSHYLKEEGYTLRNGEKIAVSHLVSGWLKLSGKEMLKKSKEFHNATNQYPECSRPLIIFAVEMVLSER